MAAGPCTVPVCNANELCKTDKGWKTGLSNFSQIKTRTDMKYSGDAPVLKQLCKKVLFRTASAMCPWLRNWSVFGTICSVQDQMLLDRQVHTSIPMSHRSSCKNTQAWDGRMTQFSSEGLCYVLKHTNDKNSHTCCKKKLLLRFRKNFDTFTLNKHKLKVLQH